jgi:hypothetical protein
MLKVYALTFWIAGSQVVWLSDSYNQKIRWLVVWIVDFFLVRWSFCETSSRERLVKKTLIPVLQQQAD